MHYSKPYLYSTNSLRREAKLLKIKINYNIWLSLFVHKLYYYPEHVPDEFSDCLIKTITIHSCPTRNCNNIYLTKDNQKSLSTITARSSIIWNKLPLPNKNIIDRQKFKTVIIEQNLLIYN